MVPMNVNNLRCGPRGLELIKAWEQCRLVAYQDEKGIWTNGWGHVGADVGKGTRWTQEYADKVLAQDVAWAEDCVNRNVTVVLTQEQFDALVVFVFNVGPRQFKASTLLIKLNEGDFGACPSQFRKFSKVTDPITKTLRVSNGLVRRRAAEIALFTSV
jgi:lysozyme